MSNYRLTSKIEASAALASYFLSASSSTSMLCIREDRCFKPSEWLSLGTIQLEPGEPERGEEKVDRFVAAINLGFFEWSCPAFGVLSETVITVLDLTKDGHKKKVHRVLDSIANVAARVGLVHPLFDADSIAQMPFRRPTTVVPDTSAILQGGLDFVVRFLYPMARIKVPALGHMEILNSADNYFKYRRAEAVSNKLSMLMEHAKSQGGQRALLRLELQTDAEIERGRLGADPLRGVIHPDSDQEDRNLGLERVQRSFADRLIFETARQHLIQASPDHPVTLMTSDQGLARMTLGEGMQPLFFEAITYSRIGGERLSGTTFNPFSGQIYSVCLTDLLWELAVTFGTARLATPDETLYVEVCALDEMLSWKPYHARDDLLWVRTVHPPTSAQAVRAPRPPKEKANREVKTSSVSELRPSETKPRKGLGIAPRKVKDYSGSYRFSVPKLLRLTEALASAGSISQHDVLPILSIESGSQLEDYRNFLLAGQLIEGASPMVATDQLKQLYRSLKAGELATATEIFRRVPSFAAFYDFLAGKRDKNPVAERARNTYVVLAEILGIGLEIPNERIYGTLSAPSASEFAEIALEAHQSLGGTPDKYILTGLWLEALVREKGLHPITSRALLESARKEGFIERFTEGSTPETSYQNHVLNTLDFSNGSLVVRRVGLFEGDFLLPGKSSVSLRLKRGQQ